MQIGDIVTCKKSKNLNNRHSIIDGVLQINKLEFGKEYTIRFIYVNAISLENCDVRFFTKPQELDVHHFYDYFDLKKLRNMKMNTILQ